MDFIGENEGLYMGFPFPAEALDQLDGLEEFDVPVVVPVHHENRRAPKADVGHGRGIKGCAHYLLFPASPSWAFGAPIQHPIMDSMEVNTGGEKLGIPGQAQRRQVASIRAAPEPDFFGVYFRPRLQVLSGRDDILVL